MGTNMDRRTLLGAATLAIALASRAGAQGEASAVTIDNFTFTPATLAVAKGATVSWTNRDDIPHVVVLTALHARSPVLDTGQSYAFAFGAAGTYDYFCALHPHMKGRVVVT
jgi:amicyanin